MGNDAEGTLTAVHELLPGAGAELVSLVRETRWSQVLRVRATVPTWSGPRALIVKRYPEAGTEWARESTALAVMPAGTPAPSLISSSASPPLVVMADAGEGPSVASALLTGGAGEATTALDGFADALAALHLGTLGSGEAFSSGLAARSGGAVPPTAVTAYTAGAADDLGRWCSRLDVAVPGDALAELAALPDRIAATGPFALTSSDICPDNNVRTDGGGYVLIDFEDAEWRPLAWDAAYFTVPWPGCWCSFGLPPAVADQALARYRSAVAARLPYAGTPDFAADVALAATGWALIATSWYVGNALGDDPPQHDEAETPTRRARILHYLAAAQRDETVPELAELARRLRKELARRWGETVLPYAPAFRAR